MPANSPIVDLMSMPTAKRLENAMPFELQWPKIAGEKDAELKQATEESAKSAPQEEREVEVVQARGIISSRSQRRLVS